MTDQGPSRRGRYGFTPREVTGWAMVLGIPFAIIVVGILVVLFYPGPVGD